LIQEDGSNESEKWAEGYALNVGDKTLYTIGGIILDYSVGFIPSTINQGIGTNFYSSETNMYSKDFTKTSADKNVSHCNHGGAVGMSNVAVVPSGYFLEIYDNGIRTIIHRREDKSNNLYEFFYSNGATVDGNAILFGPKTLSETAVKDIYAVGYASITEIYTE
jgi:hypothetical protein